AARAVVDVEVLVRHVGIFARRDLRNDLLEEAVGLGHHVRFGDAGELARRAPRLARARQLAREARGTLDAGTGHDLRGEAAGTVVADTPAEFVRELGHRAREVGKLALASGIETF